jgi:hypothetical protein
MRKMKSKIGLIVLVSIIAFFFLAVMPVSAEVTELWNRTYDGGFNDYAYGVATDTEGNVIVTGYSFYEETSMGGLCGYNTIKYDKDGNELWNRTYDGGSHDKALGVATDTSGNVIVTGQSYTVRYNSNGDWDYHTIKYDADGTVLWSRTYNSGSFRADCAKGVATDTEGNVIVTGGVHDGSAWDCYTIKYDADGNVLWCRTVDDGEDCRSVATDAEGNVIVTSTTRIIKYDRDGILLWDITGGGAGITTDTEGNVIIAGWSKTVMYDADGTELWSRIYGGGSKDRATGVATDAEDNVIFTGYVWDGSTYNYYTIKYGETNNEPIPEFSTIAIPVVAILGLMFLFSRRKRKEWNSCKRGQ